MAWKLLDAIIGHPRWLMGSVSIHSKQVCGCQMSFWRPIQKRSYVDEFQKPTSSWHCYRTAMPDCRRKVSRKWNASSPEIFSLQLLSHVRRLSTVRAELLRFRLLENPQNNSYDGCRQNSFRGVSEADGRKREAQ